MIGDRTLDDDRAGRDRREDSGVPGADQLRREQGPGHSRRAVDSGRSRRPAASSTRPATKTTLLNGDRGHRPASPTGTIEVKQYSSQQPRFAIFALIAAALLDARRPRSKLAVPYFQKLPVRSAMRNDSSCRSVHRFAVVAVRRGARACWTEASAGPARRRRPRASGDAALRRDDGIDEAHRRSTRCRCRCAARRRDVGRIARTTSAYWRQRADNGDVGRGAVAPLPALAAPISRRRAADTRAHVVAANTAFGPRRAAGRPARDRRAARQRHPGLRATYCGGSRATSTPPTTTNTSSGSATHRAGRGRRAGPTARGADGELGDAERRSAAGPDDPRPPGGPPPDIPSEQFRTITPMPLRGARGDRPGPRTEDCARPERADRALVRAARSTSRSITFAEPDVSLAARRARRCCSLLWVWRFLRRRADARRCARRARCRSASASRSPATCRSGCA